MEIHSLLRKKALFSPKKVLEFQIIEIVENVCNLKEGADWILRIDMVEKGDKLEVMGYLDTVVAELIV
ncbi:hypothetical protein J5N97_001640 [Dioscorea zingiberensis]|uniref:Uncharacterized protein n=1 Tax=Dioscorea zingiberensis TaxID=325984 RepID=A0A9D5BTU5_9LILI|nr:hypothetical protein J5N97_001640 [Dioscorea zingiberensis]